MDCDSWRESSGHVREPPDALAQRPVSLGMPCLPEAELLRAAMNALPYKQTVRHRKITQ